MSVSTVNTQQPKLDCEFVSKSVKKHATKTKLNVYSALMYLALIKRDLTAVGQSLLVLQYRAKAMKFGVDIETEKQKKVRLLRTQARIEGTLQHHLDEISAPECRSLLEYVHLKFPRELRNMVYANITSQMGSCQLQQRSARFPSLISVHPATTALLPQILGTTWDYLGKDTYHSLDGASKRELAESWYRHTIFKIAHHTDISTFFEHDIWKVGLAPEELIGNLEILISYFGNPFDFSADYVARISRLRKNTKIIMHLNIGNEDADPFFMLMDMCIGNLRDHFHKIKPFLQRGHVVFLKFSGSVEFKFKIELEELNEKAWADKIMLLNERHEMAGHTQN
jgi:hypothetical protein